MKLTFQNRLLLLSVISVAILIGGGLATYNYLQFYEKPLSETTLENIEALTGNPDGEGNKKYYWCPIKKQITHITH